MAFTPLGTWLAANVVGDELLYLVTDPTGTANSKYITIDQFKQDIPANTVTVNILTMANTATPANTNALTLGQGEIFWDADYIYVATANNVVKRAALSSF